MNRKQVTLNWQGPMSTKNKTLPENEDVLKEMQGPGVYIYTDKYPDKIVTYVGKANDLLWRIEQHYSNFLGGLYTVRNSDGTMFFNAKDDWRFEFWNKINENWKTRVEQLHRLKFYYATCRQKLQQPIESLLIAHMKTREGNGDKITGPRGCKLLVQCDNERREGYGANSPAIRLKSKFGPDQQYLLRLFGDKPLNGEPPQ